MHGFKRNMDHGFNRVRSLTVLLAALATLAFSSAASAAPVLNYQLSSLGSGQWRYAYTLQGEAPAAGFDGLTVYFDASQYSLVGNVSAPSGWDVLTVQPDQPLQGSGLVDLLHLAGALAGAIAPVQFSVDFDYIGAGTPGSQRFELYNLSPFAVVQSGQTQPGKVAEPATGALAALALLLGASLSRARRRR